MVCAMSKLPLCEKDKEKKIKRSREVVLNDAFPVYEKLDERMKERGEGYLVGDSMSYADLIIFNTLSV